MNNSLQTIQFLTDKINEMNGFSFMHSITRGGLASTLIMMCLCVLFVISIFIFLKRFFIIKRFSEKSSLLNDIKDLIYEGKIDAALDLCKKKHTPESRILYRGLIRIGKPTQEISNAIEDAAQLEIFKLEKNTGILGTISGAAPMLGFIGTVIGMIITFLSTSQEQISTQMMSEGIYIAMTSSAAGMVIGLISYLLYNILVAKIDHIIYTLQLTTIDFLDVLNKPISQS